MLLLEYLEWKTEMEKLEEKAPVKLIFLGGFSGSGKTTLMMELAGLFSERGEKVGFIVNNQADDDYDSDISESSGYDAGKVSGSCFCYNFPEFIRSLNAVIKKGNPDYIIAEPVGSCTDLLYTVIIPLEKYYQNTVKIKSFLVLIDGFRLIGKKYKLNLENPVLPGDILISRQLKEANVILVNKCDLLSDSELRNAMDRIYNINSCARVVLLSAVHGAGIDSVLKIIEETSFNSEMLVNLETDNDLNSQAEDEYGWYNGKWDIEADEPVIPDALGLFVIHSFFDSPIKDTARAELYLAAPSGSMKIAYFRGRINAEETVAILEPVSTLSIQLDIRVPHSAGIIVNHIKMIFKDLENEFRCKILNYNFKTFIPGVLLPRRTKDLH